MLWEIGICGRALSIGEEPVKGILVWATAHQYSNEKYGPGMKFARSALKVFFLAGSSILRSFELTSLRASWQNGQNWIAKKF